LLSSLIFGFSAKQICNSFCEIYYICWICGWSHDLDKLFAIFSVAVLWFLVWLITAFGCWHFGILVATMWFWRYYFPYYFHYRYGLFYFRISSRTPVTTAQKYPAQNFQKPLNWPVFTVQFSLFQFPLFSLVFPSP
jgi:hypothetical protein